MSTIKVDTIATRTGSGNITSSNTIDLNGNELILDVDGDTSLTADTDDQIDIRIGGTDVGTLTQNSGKLTINSSGTNLSFAVGGTVELNTDGTQFYPQTDNSHNLGTASLRFKDLYLSSGVFLGGTGAANELDDYEEGTWTPDIRNNDNANTFSTELGRYVKIGSVVYIYFYSDGGNTGGGGGLTVRNLPFTYTSNDFVFGARGMAGVNNSSDSTRRNLIVNFNSGGASSATLYYGGTFLSDTLSYISGFAVYKTDS